MRRPILLAAVVALTACSTVRNVNVRPDYEQVDRTKTLRVVVATRPDPAGLASVGELWTEIARKYVNDKRDFIAYGAPQGAAMPPLQDLCAPNVEGVLHLEPTVAREGDGVEASVKARLFRCHDGESIWSAEGGGSWPSDDDQLKEMTAVYAGKLGDEVQPYVAPTFRLLRAVLDTLPFPKLEDEEAILEKIELSD